MSKFIEKTAKLFEINGKKITIEQHPSSKQPNSSSPSHPVSPGSNTTHHHHHHHHHSAHHQHRNPSPKLEPRMYESNPKMAPNGHQQSFKIEDNYSFERTIGQGHYAVVKSARHIFSGERVAIKIIDKTKLDKVSKEHLFQEVKCMKLVKHPNVVRLYEVIDTPSKLYLVLELGDGGDLYDMIMKHTNGISEKKAKLYFKQIVRAIKYCHDLHVVHRDLKPENVVFFEQTGQVKLTDFGFSNIFTPGTKLDTSCGSLAYSAPELLLGDSYDAPAVDVWSLGVILYMLVVGRPPFQEANDSETLTMILDCKYFLPKHLSSECVQLISSMLVREPSKRIPLDDILNHSWLTDAIDHNGGDCYFLPPLYSSLNSYFETDLSSRESPKQSPSNGHFVKSSNKFTKNSHHRSNNRFNLNEEQYLKMAPLIKTKDHHLCERDRQEIIESMVNGQIAERSEILK